MYAAKLILMLFNLINLLYLSHQARLHIDADDLVVKYHYYRQGVVY